MSSFPPSFRHIHLELARETGLPDGDGSHGYDILAPLTEDSRLDAETWKAHQDKCRVRRFRRGEEDAIGKLVHGPGGRWFIQYDVDAQTADTERGLHFETEHFVPGEYVSMLEDDGQEHTFRVTQVRMLD